MVQVLLTAFRAATRRTIAVKGEVTRSVLQLQKSLYTTQSSVYTWGNGTLGQLGHGPVIKSGMRNAYEELTPKLVEALEGKAITFVDFGASHSAAIDETGKLYVWGSNEYGKLGLGESSEIEVLPREVEALRGVKIVDVSCGDYFTAAVDEDGKMYSWGWGGSTMKGAGGLGHAGGKDEPLPRLLTTLVDQGVPMATVECGEFHTVALTKDGEIWAWGNGEYGRLGNGESDTCEVPEPIEFFSEDNIVSIAAGRDFSFALTDKGELYSWGGNSHNQLGIGGGLAMDVYNIESIPVLIEAFDGVTVKQIAAGYDHAAAVTADGRLYMWGAKIWIEPHEMTAVNDHNIVQVACGRQYTAALTDTGKVFTFGKGSSNCLGHGDRKNQLQPVHIQALAGVQITSVSCGDYHMGAIARPHAEAADTDFSLRE
ncbi:FOG: RCC1 domain [Plasmopara halstedii]|uniref:FOG: RCC1 domain n=1 Tax=Plasmopara halstedii TaxID=4781 RepID=A0A0P1AVQ2_PLAHL|nr:FOG: RCC1 domain [Plasmopara halstedii]CEG44772.1 FOG: RCC1 domain [Plasmopara halstedii]|eukprot:XP_024581141.1 FOG: RCC1 domain [Plasmopara halstedii]